jgi:murein DD-endopeptidase MepM/ murein hydrolase activator NlpD
MRTLLSSCLLAAAAGALAAGPASAGAADPSAQVQVTAVSVAPTVSPAPVLGTDGRVHLPYELLMVNFGTDPATIGSVEALDAADPSRILDAHSGADLAAHFKIAAIGGQSPATAVIGPGQEGIVWLDASVDRWSGVPRRILNRVNVTYPAPQSGGLIPADVTVTVAPTTPSSVPTPVIAPPLAGPRWLDANGCCDIVSAHRGAVNPLNGRTNFPERTAIDFIQLNDQYRLFTGDATKLSSYAYYGTPITAVADGEVIAVRDGLPNQVPTIEPPIGSLPLADFGGNHVVEKFEYAGHTYYAFYAHMAPGSVTAHVRLGEHVHAGQQIGSLGNSGNSSAPHLHFQVMDRPSELASQGLPYEFDHLRLAGRAVSEDNLDAILAGEPLQFAPGVQPGPMNRRMPLNLDLVDFPPAHE